MSKGTRYHHFTYQMHGIGDIVPPAYECHEFISAEERIDPDAVDNEEIQSYLTNFMVMAALAREYEMERMGE